MKRRILRTFGPPLPSRWRVVRVSTEPTRYHVIDTRTGRTAAVLLRLAPALRRARELGRLANLCTACGRPLDANHGDTD